MGCGSSSLKGTTDVGTSDVPSVPTNAPAGAPLRNVKTNFSTIDYDATPENNKSSLLKERAPDELDEGPSRNASAVDEMAGNKAEGEAEGKLEPYKTIGEEPVQEQPADMKGEKTPALVQ